MAALKLRPVSHPKGDRNQYCGPSAISCVTGMGSGEAARLLRAVTGKPSIKGIGNLSMFRALAKCGIIPATRWEPDTKVTLAAWLRLTSGRRGGKVFLVVAGNHYQVISGNRYACGRIAKLGVVGVDHPKVKRRALVAVVWELSAPHGVTIPAAARKPPPSERLGAPVRYRAWKLAAQWGIVIERHTDLDTKPWWVSHPDLDETDADPHDGDHYVHDWPSVLERVQEYAQVMQARGWTK